MNIITVRTSHAYRVLIGAQLLSQLGQQLRLLRSGCKVAVITDDNVAANYLGTTVKNLSDSGYDVYSYTFPAGEASKNQETLFNVLNFLAQNHFTRTDFLVALGGGVVGDLTGFAAASYLRGIPYVQVPTSLLAMVDASVGGKTAINLPAGKNLVGAFYQPAMVLCDTALLDTLPEDYFRDGCAEIIKYAILYDPALFDHLCSKKMNFDRQYVISRCIELKQKVVTADEFDTGMRQMLNLGHTVGHAIEACSCYQTSHGFAVAIGIAMICRAALAAKMCDQQSVMQIISLLTAFRLPVHTTFSAEQLAACILSDKKRCGDTIGFVIPTAIGNATIMQVSIADLQSFLEAGF